MKQKIQKLAQGKFEEQLPSLILPGDHLELQVYEGEPYKGYIHLESSGRKIKGLLSCEHPNVELVTREFHHKKVDLTFLFHGEDTCEGDTFSGVFVITSEVGEYLLPFSARVIRHYMTASIGRIKTLNDFSNLAKLNWKEALKIFQSAHFPQLFHSDEAYLNLLYEALTIHRTGSHEMEEFLIAIGKKERSAFQFDVREKFYRLEHRKVQDMIPVSKTEWGYTDIRVSSDSEFVVPKKDTLDDTDFIGKHAQLPLLFLPEKMHGGRNFARITLKNSFFEDSLEICATNASERKESSGDHYAARCAFEIQNLYFRWQIKKIGFSDWLEQSMRVLDHWNTSGAKNLWCRLVTCFVQIMGNDCHTAKESLLELSKGFKSQKTLAHAFFLYLTWLHPDLSFAEDALSRIKEIAARFSEHPLPLWILLQTDESLVRNAERKYAAIRSFSESSNCTSAGICLAAARILETHPEFLQGNLEFEQRLICWMSRYDLITDKIQIRIQGIAATRKKFANNFYQVLTRCYKRHSDQEMIRTICTYLIKNNRYGDTYFYWFQKGIELRLKIVGLYEAYMLSWTKASGELPTEVIKYFAMNSSLPSKRKAMLFAYVVRNRQRIGKDWNSYMTMVDQFARKELQKNSISDDLAVIYEHMRSVWTPEQWNEYKGQSEFVYKAYVQKSRMNALRVYQKDIDQMPQRCALSNQSTYLYLTDRPYVIVYEDMNNTFYASRDDIRISKLLSGNHIFQEQEYEDVVPQEKKQEHREPTIEERLDQMEAPLAELVELYLEAGKIGLQKKEWALHLLVRMLFTGYFPQGHAEVAKAILKDPEAKRCINAYFICLAHEAIRFGENFPREFYYELGHRLVHNVISNMYCEMIFLQLYAKKPMSAYENRVTMILEKYMREGIYLPSYKDMPEEILRKYLLYDLEVLEYRGEAEENIYCKINGQPIRKFRECMPGYYTLALHMYAGESCEYAILDQEKQVLVQDTLTHHEREKQTPASRYDRISGLIYQSADKQAQQEYAQLADMVEVLFVPIKE